MKLFKSYTLTWWQISILELTLLTIGAAIGAHWHGFFSVNLGVLIVIAAIGGIYITYVALKQ